MDGLLMTEKQVPFTLNALLYFLNYIQDVKCDPILPPPLIKQIKERYKPELVIGFQEAIRWAIENQDFEFCKQIPVKYSNAEILIYFENLDAFFQREGIYKLHSS